MSPGCERGRPGGATSDISTAIKTKASVGDIADKAEQQRRTRLRRDLHRLADRLTPYDAPAAALARAWAREVAA